MRLYTVKPFLTATRSTVSRGHERGELRGAAAISIDAVRACDLGRRSCVIREFSAMRTRARRGASLLFSSRFEERYQLHGKESASREFGGEAKRMCDRARGWARETKAVEV